MAATGLHVLSAVGLRIGEKHKLSVGGVALPRVSVSVNAFSSEQRSAKSFRDYLEAARDFIRPEENSPSRWFSPLESKARCDRAPLLLFLPGIDGIGLGLMRQHHKLGQMFDIWCLHIPPSNRTAFPVSGHLVNPFILLENLSVPALHLPLLPAILILIFS